MENQSKIVNYLLPNFENENEFFLNRILFGSINKRSGNLKLEFEKNAIFENLLENSKFKMILIAGDEPYFYHKKILEVLNIYYNNLLIF